MGKQNLTTGATTEKTNLEDMFQELDHILEQMENADVPLEEAFSLYKNGIRLIRRCNKKLDLVEKKVLVLAKDGTEEPLEG